MELKFNKNIWIKVFGVANHKLRLTVEGEYSITKPRRCCQDNTNYKTNMYAKKKYMLIESLI